MQSKTYTTIQGDTWDMVAFRVFGNEYLMTDLIETNPAHREVVIFPAGIVLNVPVIAEPEPQNLPPWKRGDNQ